MSCVQYIYGLSLVMLFSRRIIHCFQYQNNFSRFRQTSIFLNPKSIVGGKTFLSTETFSSHTDLHAKHKSLETIEGEVLFESLVSKVRDKNFPDALEVFQKIKAMAVNVNVTMSEKRTVEAMLSLCCKAEHTFFAEDTFHRYLDRKVAPGEPAFLALIRCYSDGGRYLEALALVKQMITSGIEPKLRTYNPIIESYCSNNLPENALDLMHHMKLYNISPSSEQIFLLISSAKRTNALSNPLFCQSVNDILNYCRTEVLGMPYEDVVKVIEVLTPLNKAHVDSIKEVLINNIEDITGSILEEDKAGTGKICALNACLDSPVPGIAAIPFTSVQSDKTTYINRLQQYADERNLSINFSVDKNNTSTPSSLVIDPDEVKWKPETYRLTSHIGLTLPKKAALVDISGRTCVCPNCGGRAVTLFLSTAERQQVRSSLMKIAANTSYANGRNLQDFSDWLERRDPYDFIVDGANVAYNRQNFEGGRFSYHQIELVLQQLRQERPGSRVLVLLPYSYAQKVVPNSVKTKTRSLTYLSQDDERILSSLKQDDVLYVVPQGADDDWYWLYATVATNGSHTTHVVTNDLIRDHRLAFQDSRGFLRWKQTHVVHFDVMKVVDEDSKDPGAALLVFPDRFSREMQLASNGFWHIPVTDRRMWLCLGLSNELVDNQLLEPSDVFAR